MFSSVNDVRHEVNRLLDRLDHFSSKMQPRLMTAADDASAMGDQAQRRVRAEAARVSSAVQDQPLVALGLALITGFVIASLVKR